MMINELLPCPFCGGAAGMCHVTQLWEPKDSYWGECNFCHMSGRHYPNEAEAIDAWNTRAERTCKLIGRGSFMPKHDFYRSECSACGAMFWQTNGHLPRANYCPNCGAKVIGGDA